MEFVIEFGFHVEHIKGKEKKLIDALNRKNHGLQLKKFISWKKYLRGRLQNGMTMVACYLQVKEALQQEKLHPRYIDFKLEENKTLKYKIIVYI